MVLSAPAIAYIATQLRTMRSHIINLRYVLSLVVCWMVLQEIHNYVDHSQKSKPLLPPTREILHLKAKKFDRRFEYQPRFPLHASLPTCLRICPM